MRRTRDSGSGTIWVVTAATVVVLAAVAVTSVAAAMIARHRAGAAADLAALAAASAAASLGPDPCAVADRVAARNGGRLVGCAVDATAVVEVTVEVRPAGLAGRVGVARVSAMAGPVTAGSRRARRPGRAAAR